MAPASRALSLAALAYRLRLPQSRVLSLVRQGAPVRWRPGPGRARWGFDLPAFVAWLRVYRPAALARRPKLGRALSGNGR